MSTRRTEHPVDWAYRQDVRNAVERIVLVTVARAVGRNEFAWVKQKTLADLCACSLDTLQRALRALEARQLINRQRRTHANGARASDLYRLGTGEQTAQPKPQSAALDEASLSRNLRSPKPQRAGVHYIEHSINTQENVRSASTDRKYPEYVERFWQAYPAARRVGKKKTAAELARLSAEGRERAITGAVRYAKRHADLKTDPRYLVHPERFVRDRRFDDEDLQPATQTTSETFNGIPVASWRQAVSNWDKLGRWDSDFGVPPDHPDFEGPLELRKAPKAEMALRGRPGLHVVHTATGVAA